MRNSFIAELETLRKKDDRIQLLVGDLGFSVIESFQSNYPDSFHNIGVAEQNMIGVAAGMASEGLLPFCYSIANFPVFRPAEFIRNLIDYHKLNVSIVGVGGGLAYGNLGYTHHAVQDFAFINSLMNFTTIAPADPSQIEKVVNFIYQKNQLPKYVRLNRNGEDHLSWNYFECGDIPIFISEHSTTDSAIVTTGSAGMFVEKYLRNSEVHRKFPEVHISLPVWGNQYVNEVCSQLSQFREIFVFEDHIRHGGFGSWLKTIGVAAEIRPFSIVEKYVGEVGTQDYFMKKYIEEELT